MESAGLCSQCRANDTPHERVPSQVELVPPPVTHAVEASPEPVELQSIEAHVLRTLESVHALRERLQGRLGEQTRYLDFRS